MEFILMRLDFNEAPSGDPTVPPAFRHVSKFRTMGVVMNVFCASHTSLRDRYTHTTQCSIPPAASSLPSYTSHGQTTSAST